jgi:DNA polymerase III epsilon subunit-like protein
MNAKADKIIAQYLKATRHADHYGRGKHLVVMSIDTETTGLDTKHPIRDGGDEVLSLGVTITRYQTMRSWKAHGLGYPDSHWREVRFEMEYTFKPRYHDCWPEAERVNHISPRDVLGCPPACMYRDVIGALAYRFDVDLIVGYNILGFDAPMLRNNGIRFEPEEMQIPVLDVMEFAKELGYAQYRYDLDNMTAKQLWLSLTTMCDKFGISNDGAHTAVSDCKRTVRVLEELLGGDNWFLLMSRRF